MRDIFIQGIQFDEKSSFQRGARLAPPLIREALFGGSSNLYAENLVSIDQPNLVDQGDFTLIDYLAIERIAEEHLNTGAKLLTLGGDHSITYPLLKAHHKLHPEIAILHIDAHCDLYDEFEGDPYSHACPFARIMEGGYAQRLVQVGIRTLNPHQAEQAKKFGVEMHQMKEWEGVPKLHFDRPVYISLDMDGFDPAYAPGVSHHEPGGLTTREVIRLIQQIDAEVIGADIVEYNPERDVQQMTAYLAAKMMKEILVKMM
ncbi:MAG: agmatinase [Bacteroidota bacterium]